MRASNLADGRAFEFESYGRRRGRRRSARATPTPRRSRRTPRASPRAERRPGRRQDRADEIVAQARALTKFAAVTGDTGALSAGRGREQRLAQRRRATTPSRSPPTWRGCAYTATVIGGEAQQRLRHAWSPSTRGRLRVRTRDGGDRQPGGRPAVPPRGHLLRPLRAAGRSGRVAPGPAAARTRPAVAREQHRPVRQARGQVARRSGHDAAAARSARDSGRAARGRRLSDPGTGLTLSSAAMPAAVKTTVDRAARVARARRGRGPAGGGQALDRGGRAPARPRPADARLPQGQGPGAGGHPAHRPRRRARRGGARPARAAGTSTPSTTPASTPSATRTSTSATSRPRASR